MTENAKLFLALCTDFGLFCPVICDESKHSYSYVSTERAHTTGWRWKSIMFAWKLVEYIQRQFQVMQASAVIPVFSGMLHTEVLYKNIKNFLWIWISFYFPMCRFIFSLFLGYFTNYLLKTHLIELWSSRIKFACAVIFWRFPFYSGSSFILLP